MRSVLIFYDKFSYPPRPDHLFPTSMLQRVRMSTGDQLTRTTTCFEDKYHPDGIHPFGAPCSVSIPSRLLYHHRQEPRNVKKAIDDLIRERRRLMQKCKNANSAFAFGLFSF